MDTRELSLYIHIPFCVRKCNYCDFLSFSCDRNTAADRERMEDYVEDLCTEIMEFAGRFGSQYHVISVFIGGGTPSLLSGGQIHRIMDCVRTGFALTVDCEVTMECNPGTVDRVALAEFHAAGVNRLSIGLQTTDDGELKALGRIHTYEEFLATYDAALRVGFREVNVDLISAIPGQTLASYKRTLQNVLRLKPSHISSYSLILEEGTPLYERRRLGEDLHLPDEDTERAMYELTQSLLSEHGYHRYEISNYAREGSECRHNKVYWKRGEYVGFGLGASSLLRLSQFEPVEGFRDCRLKNDSGPSDYHRLCHRWTMKAEGFEETEHLDAASCMEEFMFLGLRLREGISRSEFRQLFGRQLEHVYGPVLEKYIASGHLISDGDRLYLSDRGIDVSNVIFSDFLLD